VFRMNRRWRWALSLGLVMGLASQVLALYTVSYYGTGPIPQELARVRGWPDGTLNLVNHPLRVEGWHSYFSELPNDVEQFAYRMENAADANQLIEVLGRIRSREVTLALTPLKEHAQEKRTFPAVFSLGSQPILDAWFKKLPGGKFGVHQYTEPPKAMPPTLLLCLGGGKIELERLQVPARVRVALSVPVDYEKEHPNDPLLARLKRYAAERKP
jgi:hypothetical protein